MDRRPVALSLDQVSKRFGGLPALKNVSFSVSEGEILAIIGPNGAGKTTLFNVINGLYPPTSGRVVFYGRDVTKLPPYERARLGMSRTFQIPRPFGDMTVIENVAVGAIGSGRARGVPDATSIAEEVLRFLGLESKADIEVKKLNLQEKKSVELARALVQQPKLLLVDEYMSGLNPSEVDEAVKLLRRVNEESGVTILWIEHLLRAVMRLAQRVVVLNFGEIIAEGTPSEIAESSRVIEAYLGRSVEI
ncbi:MAG: ABC transporter ATP-binding protein [Thaumarchaeota archaeon]|nr:ABC transporter ATP-binding protein [Candidatus Calditenuaceae archaeon]MDW8186692.1 ABC transporter ATP-binding protein [Nitrososphaerota archaeon]